MKLREPHDFTTKIKKDWQCFVDAMPLFATLMLMSYYTGYFYAGLQRNFEYKFLNCMWNDQNLENYFVFPYEQNKKVIPVTSRLESDRTFLHAPNEPCLRIKSISRNDSTHLQSYKLIQIEFFAILINKILRKTPRNRLVRLLLLHVCQEVVLAREEKKTVKMRQQKAPMPFEPWTSNSQVNSKTCDTWRTWAKTIMTSHWAPQTNKWFQIKSLLEHSFHLLHNNK